MRYSRTAKHYAGRRLKRAARLTEINPHRAKQGATLEKLVRSRYRTAVLRIVGASARAGRERGGTGSNTI